MTVCVAVMLLEFQSSSAQQQRLRDRLAQRSAHRAAQIRARHAESGKATPLQKMSRDTGRTGSKTHTGNGSPAHHVMVICWMGVIFSSVYSLKE